MYIFTDFLYMSLQHLLLTISYMYTIYLGPIHPQHPAPSLDPSQIAVWCPRKQKQGVRSPGAGGTSGYVVTNHRVGAPKGTQVLCKSSKCRYLMSHLFSPQTVFPDETMSQLPCPFPSVSSVYPALNGMFPKMCISHHKAAALVSRNCPLDTA